jgi:hypothetical protein
LLHYCKVLLDYSNEFVIVVHCSLIIMLLLKLLNLILSLIIFCFIMKNSTPPLHPPVNPSLVSLEIVPFRDWKSSLCFHILHAIHQSPHFRCNFAF